MHVAIIIAGYPCSGKGTAAEAIVSELPETSYHLSTGDLLRQRVASGDPLFAEYGRIMGSGEQYPDEKMVQLVSNHLAVNVPESRYRVGVYDGFTRTKRQFDLARERFLFLELILMRSPREVSFMRSEQRTKERMAAGLGPRHDDTPEVVERRCNYFEKDTYPMLVHTRNEGFAVTEIDATLPKELMIESTLDHIYLRWPRYLAALTNAENRS